MTASQTLIVILSCTTGWYYWKARSLAKSFWRLSKSFGELSDQYDICNENRNAWRDLARRNFDTHFELESARIILDSPFSDARSN